MTKSSTAAPRSESNRSSIAVGRLAKCSVASSIDRHGGDYDDSDIQYVNSDEEEVTTSISSGSQHTAGGGGSITSDQVEGDSQETIPPDDVEEVPEQLESEPIPTTDATAAPQSESNRSSIGIGRLAKCSVASSIDRHGVTYDDSEDSIIQYVNTKSSTAVPHSESDRSSIGIDQSAPYDGDDDHSEQNSNDDDFDIQYVNTEFPTAALQSENNDRPSIPVDESAPCDGDDDHSEQNRNDDNSEQNYDDDHSEQNNNDDNSDIQYLETTQMDEEERQRRFGPIRRIRPHVEKPKRFFISGPLSSRVIHSKSGITIRKESRSLRPPNIYRTQGERRIPQGNIDVYDFRDDSEMLISSKPSSKKRRRGPIYAGACRMLEESFNVTFCGPPSTLRGTEAGKRKKRQPTQNRSPNRSKGGGSRKKRKENEDESFIGRQGVPEMAASFFDF